MSTTYQERADERNAEYAKATADWLASMTPDERKRAEACGIVGPSIPKAMVGGRSPYEDEDPGESVAASEWPDIAEAVDTEEDILQERFDLTEEQAKAVLVWHHLELAEADTVRQARILQRIVSIVISSNNPKVTVAGLAYAANLAEINGMGTMRQWAKRNGITVARISAVKNRLEEELSLVSSHGKSAEAVEKYREIAKTKHWRNRNTI